MDLNANTTGSGNGQWETEKFCSHCRATVKVLAARLQSDASGYYVFCPHCRSVVRLAGAEVPMEIRRDAESRYSIELSKAQRPLKLPFH